MKNSIGACVKCAMGRGMPKQSTGVSAAGALIKNEVNSRT